MSMHTNYIQKEDFNMPERIVQALEAFEYKKGGDLKIVDYSAELGGHTRTTYKIVLRPNPENSLRQCNCLTGCSNPGSFLVHEIDHMAQHFIQIFCDKCTPIGIRKKWEEVMGGGSA